MNKELFRQLKKLLLIKVNGGGGGYLFKFQECSMLLFCNMQ